MQPSLPNTIEDLFQQIPQNQPFPPLEQIPGRLQQAAAIWEWAWWLSRQFPPGLEKLYLYGGERVSLTLFASGRLHIITNSVSAMLGGSPLASHHELERVLHGKHLDLLSEAILNGEIWTRIQKELLARVSTPPQET